jgi:hypothetical protein
MLAYSFNPSKSIWIKQHIFSQFWRKELTNRCLYQQVLTELSAMTSHDNITSFIETWHFVFVLVLWRTNVLIINDVDYCGFVEWHMQFIFILFHSEVQNLLNVWEVQKGVCKCVTSKIPCLGSYNCKLYTVKSCLMWPSKGILEHGHIRQVFTKYRFN